MQLRQSKYSPIILFFGILLTAAACSNLQAIYNERAYQQAVSLKVEAASLMQKATRPYENHEDEIVKLKEKLSKAYEYAKGRPNNLESMRQWKLMKDEDRNLLGGFLKRWKQEETLSRSFVEEADDLVAEAFDTIIQLESEKIKS